MGTKYGSGDTIDVTRGGPLPMTGGPPQKRGGVLGSGMNGEDFVNLLTRAAALSQGDYTGAASIGQLMKKAQGDPEFQRFVKEQEYKQAHPDADKPDEFTRHMQAAGIDPNSEQGKALYLGHVQSMGDPYVATSLPNDHFYAGPRSGLPQALGSYAAPTQGIPKVSDEASYNAIPPGAQFMTPDGHIRVKGGGTGNSAGGFR